MYIPVRLGAARSPSLDLAQSARQPRSRSRCRSTHLDVAVSGASPLAARPRSRRVSSSRRRRSISPQLRPSFLPRVASALARDGKISHPDAVLWRCGNKGVPVSNSLKGLPVLRILSVDCLEGGDAVVTGDLESCTLEARGPQWFWLWPSETQAITPVIREIEPTTGKVVVLISREDLGEAIHAGAALPWVGPYWQAYHVQMIHAGRWRRLELEPKDASHFNLHGKHGRGPIDQMIPSGAAQTSVETEGWDHEHCEICEATIGSGGSPIGFVDPDDHWLCPECHEKWAVPRSLEFLSR